MAFQIFKRKRENRLKSYLEEQCELYPESFSRKLSEGDLVGKGIGNRILYEIDDPNIHLRANLPPEEAHNALSRADLSGPLYDLLLKYDKTRGDSPAIIPFSEAYETGEGHCTEKSILYQLAVQDNSETYIVQGLLTAKGQRTDSLPFHAWNIQFEKGNACLVDPMNPKRDGKLFKIPIDNFLAGSIITSPKQNEGRAYLMLGL